MDTDVILPKILPDEWLPGYRGRIADYNGIHTPKEVARQLALVYPSAGHWQSQTLTFIDAAAKANGMSDSEMLHRHSCLSVLIGLGGASSGSLTGERSLSAVRSLAMYNPDRQVRGCDECIAADLRSGRSTAYWRRSHQVPGQFLCSEHECLLWFAPEHELLPAGPDALREGATSLNSETLSRLRMNPFVERAVALLENVVSEGIVLDRTKCAGAFRRKLAAADARASHHGWIPALSEKVDLAFDAQWLRRLLPGLEINASSLLQAVKRCVQDSGGRPSYMHIALVASVIFCSVEQAFLAFGAIEPEGARKTRSVPSPSTTCMVLGATPCALATRSL